MDGIRTSSNRFFSFSSEDLSELWMREGDQEDIIHVTKRVDLLLQKLLEQGNDLVRMEGEGSHTSSLPSLVHVAEELWKLRSDLLEKVLSRVT